MGKAPADQFYWMDWDRDLQEHPLKIEGAWIRICCKLWWSETRGEMTKSPLQWSRILGVSKATTMGILGYIGNERIGDVAFNNTKVTVACRRMVRDEYRRDSGRRRQSTLREKGGGDPKRWTAIRIPILERDEYMCAYCGRKAETVDHVIPKSKGGTEDPFNLVACCKGCNRKKQTSTLEEAEMSFWRGFDETKLYSDIKVTPPSSSSSSSSFKNKEGGERVKIPLKNGTDFTITEDDIKEYSEAFPDLEIIPILKKIRLWNKDNPKKQKTPSGIKRHINTWLAGEQDKIKNQKAFKDAMGGGPGKGFVKDLKVTIDKKTEKERLQVLKDQVKDMKGAQEKG